MACDGNLKKSNHCEILADVTLSHFTRFILEIANKLDILQADPWVKLMSEALHSCKMPLSPQQKK